MLNSQKNRPFAGWLLLGFISVGAVGSLWAQGDSLQRVDGKLDRRAVAGPGARGQVSREGLDLSVVASIAYDDNIFQTSQNKTASLVTQVEPAIGWTAGKRDNTWVRVAYEGAAVVFVAEENGNRIDHRFGVEGAVRLDSTTLAYSARWAKLGSPAADVGGVTDRYEWGGRIAAVYRPKGKISYEIAAERTVVDQVEPAFFDFFQSSASIAARYRYSPKTEMEVAYRYGQADVDGAGSQTFQRFGGGLLWRPRSKLSLAVEGGVEFRNYEVGSGVEPYLSARVNWTPRAKTAFYAEAYRREEASAAEEGENFDVTGIRVGVNQELRDGWSAGLEYGRQTSDYFGITGQPESGREDVISFFRPSVRYAFSEDTQLAFLYQWSKNDSNDPEFSFDNNQFGVSVNHRF